MTRRILHLSDLHFGRDRPGLLRPLVETVNGIAPDLVVVSGDFTQRARLGQFRAARAFLAALRAPWLAVPGNHDTPLDNLLVRLATPWRRYRHYIHPDLQPFWEDDEVAVAGVNTVNHSSSQRGRSGRSAVARVCRAFEGHAGRRMHVAVLHHPLEHDAHVEKRLMRGAERAVEAFGRCGADIVLSGHLHTWHARPFAAAEGVLFIQAGTGLSTRVRGEPNDFNLLRIEGHTVEVEQWTAPDDSTTFAPARTTRFRKRDGAWQADETSTAV